jgi:uncharacterized protein RhaS with RHS repeats
MVRKTKFIDSILGRFADSEEGWVERKGRKAAVTAGLGCLLLILSASAYPETSASYTYDALGRLISIVYTDGTKTTTVTYSYDASGNRASVLVK